MELSNSAIVKKKKKVSKNKKSSWIKYIDNKDVEDFLDQQRLEERLGGAFTGKKDNELFVIDESRISEEKPKKLTKKDKARLPLKCYGFLENNCKIPDPVGQRTRVKSKEERKCRIRKSIEEANKRNGIIQKKILQANNDRAYTIRQKRRTPKEIVFNKDIWGEENKGVFKDGDTSWLKTETIKHHIGTIGVSVPKDITKKKSIVPAVEAPHPGMSYNPTLKDHKDLLNKVAEKELEVLKEEAHIARCTTKIFKKVTASQKETQWIEEMSQGLPIAKEEAQENQEAPAGPLSLNPPTNFLNKKTLKQRRKMKEQKEAALARKYAKIEKKKASDIYKLKFISKEIENKEKQEEIGREIREKQAELNAAKPKRLAARKFEEPTLDFNHRNEIQGNLRSLKKAGSLLSERFYSLQKRNILAPSSRVTKFKKTKVKRFTKPSHRMEIDPTLSSIKKKKK